MTTIKMSTKEWDKIYLQIKEDYQDQPSVFMIRGKMREVLGFTQRTHRYWKEGNSYVVGHGTYVTEVHLDFYNEAAQTMFRLRYL